MRYRIIHTTVRGKKRWGYRWFDGETRRQSLFNPDTGKPFLTKSDVERYLLVLQARDRARSGRKIVDVASWIFEPGSPWIDRQARRRDGRPLAPSTIAKRKRHVDKHIMKRWGEVDPATLKPAEIEEWLYSLEASNKYRNEVWVSLRMILREFQREGALLSVPRIEQPRGKPKKKSALTLRQLQALFPADDEALYSVWSDPRDRPEKGPRPYWDEYLKLAACSALMFYGGLRPQEARAICVDQLYLEHHGILVTRQVTDQNTIVPYLKGADQADDRYRYALLPARAVRLLRRWLDRAGPSWALFPRASGEEGPITNDHFYKRVRRAYVNSGIDLGAGRYTPYSGRYTWRTLFGANLESTASMELMGHRDTDTHQSYNRPQLEERIRERSTIVDQLNAMLGD